ncbi:hypothetical protein [Pedobacter sp. Leaf170]|uniref:hypothetical protein n=1 Tax=Pedobacter sp. Leaf170 TaxID=2876558 RepID=UPI001E31B917|nr:hypothetical protein [Pedobacter sp. Leaf170]
MENSQGQIRGGANLYGVTLADNINKAFPQVNCIYGGGNLHLYLPDSPGYSERSKGLLYTMLDGLPEIDAPLQRLQVIVYVNESIQCVTIINPSKFDVTALDNAKENGLSFSQPPPSLEQLEPLPLDHPYYTDKDYFRKQSKKKKDAVTFDDIKNLPNVKPILEEMRRDGIKI